MKKLLTLFALFAFTVVLLNPVSTQAANSPNFKFNLGSSDDYAKTSNDYDDNFVLDLKKPAKNLKFGLVLDSITVPKMRIYNAKTFETDHMRH